MIALFTCLAFGLFQSAAHAQQGPSREKILRAIARSRSTASPSFTEKAGPKDTPVLLLLHGLPSSSRMFEPLFARLSDRFHLIAPDYPGFGHSDWPDPKKFAYTFDHCAEIMNRFSEALGLSHYTLYMQDYGGPVGFRMAGAHPERIEALIVQDAVALNEGLGAGWKTRRAFWEDRAANESALRTNLLSLPLPPPDTSRRQRSEPRTLRSRSLVGRVRVFEPAHTGRHSKRSVLRLPHQRHVLPKVASVDAGKAAASAGHLGQVRPLL